MSFGAIGGAVAASVIGGMMSDGGQGAPAQAAVQTTNPFQVTGGLFETQFDKDKNLQLGIDPQLQALQQQGMTNAGMFGNQVGQNATADLAGQQGQSFLGGLQSDPFAAQQQLFQQQNQLLQPLQQQAQLDQEGRLFAQGRLGSTAGGNQQEALLRAQAGQTQGLFNQSFGQAQAQQAQQAQLGSQLSQLNPQLRGLFGGLQSQQLGNIFGIEDQALRTAEVGGQLASTNTGGTAAGDPSLLGQFGSGLAAGGLDSLTNQIGGLFGGGGGGFTNTDTTASIFQTGR